MIDYQIMTIVSQYQYEYCYYCQEFTTYMLQNSIPGADCEQSTGTLSCMYKRRRLFHQDQDCWMQASTIMEGVRMRFSARAHFFIPQLTNRQPIMTIMLGHQAITQSIRILTHHEAMI